MGFLGGFRQAADHLDDQVLGGRQPAPGMYTSRRVDPRVGDHVSVTAFSLRNRTGTLIRPARLPNGKPAWLVQMDNPKGLWRGRTRVGDRSLVRISSDQ